MARTSRGTERAGSRAGVRADTKCRNVVEHTGGSDIGVHAETRSWPTSQSECTGGGLMR